MAIFPLFWLSIAFLAGIAFASVFSLPFALWAWLGLGLAAFAVVWGIISGQFNLKLGRLESRAQVLVLMALAAFFMGGMRYQSVQFVVDPFHVAWFNDRDYDILVTGTLDAPADYRDGYTNLRIKVEKVDTGLESPLPAGGLVLARVNPDEEYSYGQRVRLRGQLLTPPENEEFSYRDYLARHGIHAYMPSAVATILPGNGGNPLWVALFGFRDRAVENIYTIFRDPEASLMAGILLGVDTGLAEGLQQAFKNTGTAHIIAISGFNIAIIAGIFVLIFGRLFGKTWGSVVAILGIAAYTLLVGADAAVVRAAIMGSLSIVALIFKRRQMALNSLVLVAAFMCAWNPLYLWDVGFQLSFMATLGLMLFAQPLENLARSIATRYLPSDKAASVVALVSEFFLLTLAAQITTLPVMAYHFGRISLVSIIANPFVLPAQPPLMLFGGIALLASFISIPLGELAALPAWVFPAYSIRVVKFFNNLPMGVWVVDDVSLGLVITFYIVLFLLIWKWQDIRTSFPRWKAYVTPTVVLVALAMAAILTWKSAFSLPDGTLRITFLDNGSADVALIKTPSGRFLLINGGESANVLSEALGERLPVYNKPLDWLVIASPQENQVAALPRNVERYLPANVLWAGNVEASFSSRSLQEQLVSLEVPVTLAQAGLALDLGDGATLKCLTSGPRGAILLLEWKNFRALLPVGANFDARAALDNGESIGRVDVLTLTDSGYAPANPPEWIANLAPQLIVLGVKAGNENGMPDLQTLETISGYSLLRTDENGWIEISTDGASMWVTAEK